MNILVLPYMVLYFCMNNLTLKYKLKMLPVTGEFCAK